MPVSGLVWVVWVGEAAAGPVCTVVAVGVCVCVRRGLREACWCGVRDWESVNVSGVIEESLFGVELAGEEGGRVVGEFSGRLKMRS